MGYEWANCYIKQYRNFGQRANSPTETAHADVKSHLLTERDLLHLHDALVRMLRTKKERWEQRLAKEAKLPKVYGNRGWLGKSLLGCITYHAAMLLVKEHRKVLAAMASDPDKRRP